MENSGSKLMNIVNDFSELAIIKSQLLYAKFQNTLKEDYEQKMKSVENDFLGKAQLYGKSADNCINEKNAILAKYEAEFQKIYDSRREQYINIQNEIQEMTANKVIAIANFKQIAKTKEEFLKTNGYNEYLSKKQKFEHIIETTLVHAEFDEYTKLLEELEDPLEVYNKKYIALATKFDNYDEAIFECEKKLEECITAGKEDFNQIVKHIDTSLMVAKKPNVFSSLINKILNALTKGSKFEKNVVQKMENDILNIQKENESNIASIESQTIGLIAAIEEVRDNINNEFKVSMG